MKSSYSYYDLEGPEEKSVFPNNKSLQKHDPYSEESEDQRTNPIKNLQESDVAHLSGLQTKAFDITPFNNQKHQHHLNPERNNKPALTNNTYEQLLANDNNLALGKKSRYDEQKKTSKTQAISMEEMSKYMDMKFQGGGQNQPEVKYLIEKGVPETLEEYARRGRERRRAKKELRLQRKLEREGKLKTPDHNVVDDTKGNRETTLVTDDSAKRSRVRKFSRDSIAEKSKSKLEVSQKRGKGIEKDEKDQQESSDDAIEIFSMDKKGSRMKVTLLSPPSSSESESENFLKFEEEKESKDVYKTQLEKLANSKSPWKSLQFTYEEQQISQLQLGKLTFSLDTEPLLWKSLGEVQDKMEEEKTESSNAKKSKSKVAAVTPKKPNGANHASKELVLDRDKNHYRVLGYERTFYTHDTNMVTKLQDYFVKKVDSVEDEEKGHVVDEIDEIYKFEGRYFIENPTKTCRRCHRTGHFEKMCPEEVTIRCLFCCKAHHTSSCSSFICFRCSGQGHHAKDCKNPVGSICFKCNKKGHRKHECGVLMSLTHNLEDSIAEKQANKSLIRCLNCSQFGHTNCNQKAMHSGTQRKVDELYSDRAWRNLNMELEKELNQHQADQEEASESEDYETNNFINSYDDDDSGEEFDLDVYSSSRKLLKKKFNNKPKKNWSNHHHNSGGKQYSTPNKIHHSSKKISKINLNDSGFHRRNSNKRKRYY